MPSPVQHTSLGAMETKPLPPQTSTDTDVTPAAPETEGGAQKPGNSKGLEE